MFAHRAAKVVPPLRPFEFFTPEYVLHTPSIRLFGTLPSPPLPPPPLDPPPPHNTPFKLPKSQDISTCGTECK